MYEYTYAELPFIVSHCGREELTCVTNKSHLISPIMPTP